MIYADNPLHVEIVQTLVPVANEVLEEIRLEVRAEEVVDPKREEEEQPEPSLKKKCEKILDYMYIGFLILVLLGFLGGLILLLVWMTQPNLFGTHPENY
jgi:hypothetical protein